MARTKEAVPCPGRQTVLPLNSAQAVGGSSLPGQTNLIDSGLVDMYVFSPEKLVDKENKNGTRKFLVIIALILFFSLIFLALLELLPTLSTKPEACAGCHEMDWEYESWQLSTHNKVTCINCHMDPDWSGQFQFKWRQTVWSLKHYIGDYDRSADAPKASVPNAACEQCHSLKKVTPSGDLIIPHQRHVSQQIACISCHAGLVHGGQSEERSEERTQDYQLVEQSDILIQVRPKMNICLRCHERNRITTECRACHTKLELPPQHKRGDWQVVHGHSAYRQVEPCLTCHTETSERARGEWEAEPPSVTRIARTIFFCVDCHQQRPPTHDKGWQLKHGIRAEQEEKRSCLVCHDISRPAVADGSVGTYCSQCHYWQS